MSAKYTTEIFIEKSNIVHHNLYDYSAVNYVNNSTKIEIICKLHGGFIQSPHDHLSGAGCPECSGHKRITTANFIERSNIIHNHLYDYSLVDFKNSKEKVKIICHKHGEFEQIADNHLCGAICYKCGKESAALKRACTTEMFIKQAAIIHDHKYDYSTVDYINNHTKIIIVCLKHGEFQQKPNAHLSGQGCSKCRGNCISKKEVQWLDSLQVSDQYRQKSITINGKKYRIDAYDPNTNTIYEFYGDYWHGNPKVYDPNGINVHNKFSFGELYNKTILRENLYRDSDYNVISIWEYDFNE